MVFDDKSYRRKVIEVTDDRVGEVLTKDMRRAVKHRSGTRGEDLYAYDLTTGARLTSVTNSRAISSVKPSDKMKARMASAVANGHEVIVMHNHPGSTIPTVSDIDGIRKSGAAYGIIACHDGSIYRFSVVGEPQVGYNLNQRDWANAYARRLNRGEEYALDELEKMFGVRVEHFA